MRFSTKLTACLLAIVAITGHASSDLNYSEPYRILVHAKNPNHAIWKNQHLLASTVTGVSGIALDKLKPISDDMFIYTVDKANINNLALQQHKMPNQVIDAVARRLTNDSEVIFAMRDKKIKLLDYNHEEQWNEFAPPSGVAVDGPNGAWEITKGEPSVVVAVIDTGIAHHKDLEANIVPGFNFADSNSDYTDYGIKTSYHGTHVAGIIAANGNLLGMAPLVKIQPIKVFGNDDSAWLGDIVLGIHWASGGHISSFSNPTPAKVINLSLGGLGQCDYFTSHAIKKAEARGTTVVVAAGNGQNDANFSYPANCTKALTVAATNQAGYRSYYSNYGDAVDIAAPGGDMHQSKQGGILSTIKDDYAYYQGTSMAAPHVAGIAALMYSINPELTPREIKDIIKRTASPFPTGLDSFDCTGIYSCGAGIVNAARAVQIAAEGISRMNNTPMHANPPP